MKLMFVRHAEPDYARDSLTAKGRVEAELLSRRLCALNVKAFYVSPLGRARDTAAYTLDKLGRTAQVMPWLAEFRGRSFDPEQGEVRISWDYRPRQWQESKLLMDPERWLDDPLMQGGNVAEIWSETTAGLDALLASQGYVRDGGIYRCADNRPDTLVFFCHFAITMALVSHLCGIPPVPLMESFCALPSSVTTLVSEERIKGEVFFRCMQLGDLSHLYVAGERPSTAGLYAELYDGRDSTNPAEWEQGPK